MQGNYYLVPLATDGRNGNLLPVPGSGIARKGKRELTKRTRKTRGGWGETKRTSFPEIPRALFARSLSNFDAVPRY